MLPEIQTDQTGQLTFWGVLSPFSLPCDARVVPFTRPAITLSLVLLLDTLTVPLVPVIMPLLCKALHGPSR